MASTRFSFTPLAAEPTGTPARTGSSNTRPILAFEAANVESACWTAPAPQGISGAWLGVITYFMASAITGGVAFNVAVEAVSSGDPLAMHSASSFDTDASGSDASVPGTLGYMEQISITLNMDNATQADYLRFRLGRNPSHTDDTASGDCYVTLFEIRDGG